MREQKEVLPGKVAEYLVARLVRVGRADAQAVKSRKGGRAARRQADPTGAKTAATALELEQRTAELAELVREKEDILTQITFDSAFLEGEERSVTQAEVLLALDRVEEGQSAGLRTLVGTMKANQGLESSVEEGRFRLAEVEFRIKELIGDGETRQAYRTKLARKVAIIRAARTVGSLQGIIERADLAGMELLARRSGENMALTRGDTETMGRYDLIRRNARREMDRLMGDGEIYYETKRRVLLEYRRQLLSDGFVETPGVRHEMMRIISHLKLGIPVLLRGHLGAGKTEIALHVSRKYFGHEPEFISGSEEATKYDIYGRTQIGVRPEEDKMREFKVRMDDYLRLNPAADKKEIRETERQLYQTIVMKGLTTSFFQYGPLVRAMRDGKPLLIDEMDGIPHSIIMRLNHVLTRRPGDTIRVQENGGEEITVKKGFCVMATGNIKSARYKREELDAAFLSRWWSDDIIYPPQDETYEILVASLLDKRGDLQVKDLGDLDALKRLTNAAAEIQKIFSGEHLDYFGEGADAARQMPASLKKSVLSLRHLWNVVRPWKAHNFDKPLEAYILDEFIKPSVAEDQVYLVQLFCRYRFYKTWKAAAFGIPGLTDAKLSAFQGKASREAEA